jgi:hypothetical protein
MDNNLKPQVSSEETAEQLTNKLKSIKEQELETLTEKNAQTQGCGYINLKAFPISSEALGLIPREEAEAKQLICFYYTGEAIRFASLEPTSEAVKEYAQAVAEQHHATFEIFLISRLSWEIAIKAYDKVPKIRETNTGVKITEAELETLKQEINSRKIYKQKLLKLISLRSLP